MRNLLLAILLSFIAFPGFSQSPKSEIQPHNFDSEFLEELISVRINRVRNQKGLRNLLEHPVCQSAAEDQSAYVQRIGRLTHQQNYSSKRNVQDRLKHYSGDFAFVGENLTYIYINKAFLHSFQSQGDEGNLIRTYEQAAYHIVLSWVRSRPHFKGIVDSDYTYTGVSVKMDPEKGVIYATQVFAGTR